MRIIAGEHRGRPLEAPEGLDTRPTTDRVRESVMSSLFSMLGGFEGVYVMDAFSGSGAMGLEAMSRGAEACVLNDFAKSSRDAICKNRDALGYGDIQAKVTSIDVLRAGIPRGVRPYDLVFLDPPYKTDANDVLSLVERAFNEGVLSPDCIVVYEHGERLPDDAPEPYGLKELSSKKYGKTLVTYLCVLC